MRKHSTFFLKKAIKEKIDAKGKEGKKQQHDMDNS